MTASAHAATGALLAVVIDKPILALPVAFLSHFALDAIPHFGYPGHGGFGPALKHRTSKVVAVADPLLVILLFGLLAYYSADVYVYAAALLAASPDIEWFVALFFYERRNKRPPRSPIYSVHANIQWMERPSGLWVDGFVYIAAAYLISQSLK